MELLNFKSSPSSRVSKKGAVLGVGIILATLLIKTTLAANISISGGAAIEYGQGVGQAVSCDSAIKILATDKFTNTSGGGTYTLDQLQVSDIAAACAGRSLKFNFFGASSNTPLNSTPVTVNLAANPTNGNSYSGAAWNSTSDLIITNATLVSAAINTTSASVIGNNELGTTSFVLNGITSDGTNAIPTSSIAKFTVESGPSTLRIYNIGDTGPAGGIIFLTPSSSGNTTGKYFEVARTDLGSTYMWCNNTTQAVGASSASIGQGVTNTNLMAQSPCPAGGAGYAAKAYSSGGYSDWFVPSLNEFNAIVTNVLSAASLSGNPYWTSTEYSGNPALQAMVEYAGGQQNNRTKTDLDSVRLVRSFTS